MFATTCTASARAAPANTDPGAAAIGHRSSRRANSSALIAEISAITTATCSPRATRARTAATRPAGTYRARPRPPGFGVKYAYGPCRWPPAHRQSARPHRRVCSVNEPTNTPATSGSRAASRARRATSADVDMSASAPLFLCVFTTQECDANSHDDQQPRIARVTAARSARPWTDNRCAPGGSPRSVHDSGSVTCPPTAPAHTNTRPAPRRLTNKTSRRRPFSGWNGWVTTAKPKSSLHDR